MYFSIPIPMYMVCWEIKIYIYNNLTIWVKHSINQLINHIISIYRPVLVSNNGPHHDHLECLIALQSNWTAHYTLTVTMLNERCSVTEDIKTCTRDGWQSIDIVKIDRHVKWNENYHSYIQIEN